MSIEELSTFDMETKYVPDGYDMTQKVVSSDRNTEIMMDKINELTEQVNKLTNLLGK